MTIQELWHAIDYSTHWQQGTSSPRLGENFTADLRAGLADFGLVIIDNIDLNEDEYLELTRMIGEPLNLPHQLVPSKLPGYPEIARVGNFDPETGIVNEEYAFGHYWHHDGDFWPEGKNHVVNLLHSKVVAESGGQTGFISTLAAYGMLDDETKSEVAMATVVVDPSNIEDFRGISSEEWNSNVAGERVEHPVVQELDGQKSLYLPFFDYKLKQGSGQTISYDDLFNCLFNRKELKYLHTWTENQLIVWDNLKVMHRAMGGVAGQRLLWRAQGQILHECF